MPRRGGSGFGGGGGGGGYRPSRPWTPPSGPRGYSSSSGAGKSPSPKPPSAMRQIATTAAGVAGGMIVGHAVIAALSPRERVPYYQDTYNRASAQELQDDPCGEMLKNLISCMRMAQEVGNDVTSICSQAEKQYLGCREQKGDPTY